MDTKACCSKLPVEVDYTPKGRYQDIQGLKTYVVGSSAAARGIIFIYDAFGYTPQTLQGADILSTQLNALVLMPDFFLGHPVSPKVAHPDTDPAEAKRMTHEWLIDNAPIDKNVVVLANYRKLLDELYPSARGHWGSFGLCWGGKVSVLVCSAEKNPDPEKGFRVSGQAHGGLMRGEDAEACNVPHINQVSSEEPEEQIKAYEEVYSRERADKKGKVERYPDMLHGWMGCRANFKVEKELEGYRKGYASARDFLDKYL